MKAAELFDLTGEVALVTGASSGLGWQFAKTLAFNGARVVLAARRTDRLAKLKAEIESAGGEADVVALDVAERETIPGAFDKAQDRFGTVTVLVNNAGISGEKRALEMEDADWRSVMDVNLDGVWYCAHEAAKRLVAAGQSGAIINIASVLGLRAAMTLSAYSTAKAAVIHLTQNLALEWARHNIRVNAIAPGYFLTEINRDFLTSPEAQGFIKKVPQRRFAEPEELDGTLLLLAASNASSFITGSTIVVDGGHRLSID